MNEGVSNGENGSEKERKTYFELCSTAVSTQVGPAAVPDDTLIS